MIVPMVVIVKMLSCLFRLLLWTVCGGSVKPKEITLAHTHAHVHNKLAICGLPYLWCKHAQTSFACLPRRSIGSPELHTNHLNAAPGEMATSSQKVILINTFKRNISTSRIPAPGMHPALLQPQLRCTHETTQ